MRIREAEIEDCGALGLITVSAAFSAFLGAVPEEDLDFGWTPEASAANWRTGFSELVDRGQDFDVMEDAGRVIAFVWAQPWARLPAFDACIRGLYVLPTRQKNGHGRALVQHAAAKLHERGQRSLEIGCVKENPSCGFYRRLGGREVGRMPVRVDRYETEEILFGWADLTELIE